MADPIPDDPWISRTEQDGSAVEDIVPVAEERISVSRGERTRVAAKVAFRTREERVEVAEPVRRTWTEVRRDPCDFVSHTPPREWREADGTRVIPVVEEILVRAYRVTEEIRLVERTEMREVRDTVTLRRQEVSVTDTPANPSFRPGP